MTDLKKWATEQGVSCIYQFGSSARGRARDTSDIDIGLLTKHDIEDWEQEESLREDAQAALASHFQVPTSKIDVSVINNAPPAFAFRVVKPRKILYDDRSGRRVAYERKLFGEYQEYRYWEDFHYQAMKEKLHRGT